MPIPKIILEYIQKNKVTTLDFSKQNLEKDDIDLLINLLKDNTSLEVICFAKSSEFLLAKLREVFKTNTTIIDVQEVNYLSTLAYDSYSSLPAPRGRYELYTRQFFVKQTIKDKQCEDFFARNKALRKSFYDLGGQKNRDNLYDLVAELILKHRQLSIESDKLETDIVEIKKQRPPIYDFISTLIFYLVAFDDVADRAGLLLHDATNFDQKILQLGEQDKWSVVVRFLSVCSADKLLISQLSRKKENIFAAFLVLLTECSSKQERLELINTALDSSTGLYQVFSYHRDVIGYYLGSFFKNANTINKLYELRDMVINHDGFDEKITFDKRPN